MSTAQGAAQVLDLVLARLHALVDSTKQGDMCGVSPEHKEAVQTYVDSWIEPELFAVVRYLEGAAPMPKWMVNSAREQRGHYPRRDRTQKSSIDVGGTDERG